ncbi:N-acetylmuramoyl-L-alanine amidase family protein [Oribacterium sp. WCC10]|uniref:N-acetylmuramoyl-L-alanine amidase family protein n=1 Tax=Oribacterium sp. WCC10 TaxID=1855343 RepID=UPI0015879133|nr:N-acetylmuramoyl-L-alanine amidase family protein [Oribacterium sp. WCC10]
MNTLAATQPINNVSIKIRSKLEVGRKLPSEIEINKTSIDDNEVSVISGSSKYEIEEAEWESGAESRVKSGDKPSMRLTLKSKDISKNYFLSSYRSSNVTVTGGKFVSATKKSDDLEITIQMDPVKGKFDEPTDVYWNDDKLGEIRWTRPDNSSGTYELQLMRDNVKVTSVTTSGLLYNFYPYMTQAGKYSVNIRTILVSSEQKQYATNSDWQTSTELTITDRDVSDGKGKEGEGGTAKPLYTFGWYKENGFWYYRYLDDNHLQGAGWARIDGQWYLFNQYGQMQTGWQIVNDRTYFLLKTGEMYTGWMKNGNDWFYLIPKEELRNGEIFGQMANNGWRMINSHYYFFKSNGAMYTGWLYDNGKYYFLNDIDNSLYGVMFTGWIHRNGKTYYCDDDGSMVEGWKSVNGNMYYFYPGSGQMATNAYIDGYYVNNDGIRQ